MGKGLDYIINSLEQNTDDCIIWPFSLVGDRAVVYIGKGFVKASHVVLERSGQPRPRPDFQALHNPECNNPACINKKHLRWGTALENQLDRFKSGTMTSAKLTEDDVRSIRTSTVTAREAAKLFGVSIGTIHDVRQRVTWRHVT